MPKCTRIKRKHRKICIGDLDTAITLQDRALTPPASGVIATETFTDTNTDIWSLIETTNGETVFDGTNTEVDVTHKIYIAFITGITEETWILSDGERIDILNVENLEKRNEWLLLRCTNKGTTANAANEA